MSKKEREFSNQFPVTPKKKAKYLYNLVDEYGRYIVRNAPYAVCVAKKKEWPKVYKNCRITRGMEIR